VSQRLSLWLLILITFLTYLPSFQNHFLWDDEQFIYRNVYVTSFDLKNLLTQNTVAGANVISNYYRPLTSLSFAVDHAIWGLQPIAFHFTNTALHITAGIFLYLLLVKLKLRNQAFWIALIFLLHPLQTEAVTYINSRGDSLYAALSFFGLYCFSLALEKKPVSLTLSDRILKLSPTFLGMVAVASFGLSLMAKEIALATMGLYWLVGGVYWVDSKENLAVFIKKHGSTLISLVLISITSFTYLALRSTVLRFDDQVLYSGTEYGQSLLVRVLTFSRTIWVYLQLIVWPYPLHMERTTEVVTSVVSIWPWLTTGLSVAVFATGWLERNRNRTVWIWMGSAWFIGMLIPVSGIIPINGMIYEHWLYVPLAGFCILIAGWLSLLFSYRRFRRIFTLSRNSTHFLLMLLMTIYIVLTLRQNYIWNNPIRFYTYTLGYTDSARLHNNLANAFADAGRYQEAVPEYLTAIAMGDYYPQAHYNLGNTYAQLGNIADAEAAYQRALALDSNFQLAKLNLLLLYIRQNKSTAAMTLIEELLPLYPDDRQLQLLKTQLQTQNN